MPDFDLSVLTDDELILAVANPEIPDGVYRAECRRRGLNFGTFGWDGFEPFDLPEEKDDAVRQAWGTAAGGAAH